MERLTDKFGRPITDLRIAITDRCNYKCVYCRTGNEGAQYAELPFADYARMARVFAGLGIEKIRITGGEPLLRRGVVGFVEELAGIAYARRPPAGFGHHHQWSFAGGTGAAAEGRRPAASHGFHGRGRARALCAHHPRLKWIRGVLAGIRAARRAGLDPVKVNCVLLRGFNDDQIVEFGKFARDEGVVVRFIEFMPLEEDRVWSPEIVVTLAEVLDRIRTFRPLVEIPHTRSETARRYTFDDGVGEIGIIAPVSQPFCGHCSRVRVTSDGKIRTCLFSLFDHDLHEVMRRGGSDEDMAAYIRQVIAQKEARHHIGEPGFEKPSRSMVHIGG